MSLINTLPEMVLTTKADEFLNWTRKSSVWWMLFGLACCAIDQTIPITAQLKPSAQTGNIQVVSTPSGAMVTLDRSQSANTPYTFYNIPVGSHEVSVYMSGYQTFYTSVNVNEGQTAYVNAILQPIVTTGSLSVSSSPSGAAVYVDGIYQGVTSTTIGNLVPGSHSVRLAKAGYQDWTGSVSIAARSTTYLNPTLVANPQPQYATVSISSSPAGANTSRTTAFAAMVP